MVRRCAGATIVLLTFGSVANAQTPVIRCGDAASIEIFHAEVKKADSGTAWKAWGILQSRLEEYEAGTLKQDVCDSDVQSLYEDFKTAIAEESKPKPSSPPSGGGGGGGGGGLDGLL